VSSAQSEDAPRYPPVNFVSTSSGFHYCVNANLTALSRQVAKEIQWSCQEFDRFRSFDPFPLTNFVFEPEPSASPARFWLDCCDLCPPVTKQIVFWILFLGLGCLFCVQKLHERRRQHPAKASLATAASHSSLTPSASPVSPVTGQPAKPKPTAILPPALKPKPTPMLPKPTPMLPKPTPMLRPNPNGV